MKVTLLVAMGENRVIGQDGRLPWHLSSDLKRFRALTMGHPIIMGRRTFDSIGRALPGRRTIVLSRDPNLVCEGAWVAASLEEAFRLAADDPEVFVVGGSGVFEEALPWATHIALTRVHASPEGDVRFPDIDWSQWRRTSITRGEADERNDHAWTFETYERITSAGPGAGSGPAAWSRAT
jgi:dihydrofolate reductase